MVTLWCMSNPSDTLVELILNHLGNNIGDPTVAACFASHELLAERFPELAEGLMADAANQGHDKATALANGLAVYESLADDTEEEEEDSDDARKLLEEHAAGGGDAKSQALASIALALGHAPTEPTAPASDGGTGQAE